MSRMSFDFPVLEADRIAPVERASAALTRRVCFAGLVMAAGISGFAVTSAPVAAQAAANAGEDLTRLLQAMAALKAAFILPAVAAILWRLGTVIRPGMFAAYAVAAMSMAVSIGLIWHMAHVGAGAFLMHAGLIATLVMLFRDKAVGERLAKMLKARAAGA